MNIDFKIRPRKKAQFDEFDNREQQPAVRRHYTMAWIAVGTTVAGVGTSLYASNKASKDAQAARNANQDQFDKAQEENWKRYMLSRGVTPQGEAVNTRLPLWASIARSNGPRMLVPTGTPAPAMTPRLVSRVPQGLSGYGSPAAAVAAAGSKGTADMSTGDLLKNPVAAAKNGITHFWDPLNIF